MTSEINGKTTIHNLLIKTRIWRASGFNLLIAGVIVQTAYIFGFPMDFIAAFIVILGVGNIAGSVLCASKVNSILRIRKVEEEAGL